MARKVVSLIARDNVLTGGRTSGAELRPDFEIPQSSGPGTPAGPAAPDTAGPAAPDTAGPAAPDTVGEPPAAEPQPPFWAGPPDGAAPEGATVPWHPPAAERRPPAGGGDAGRAEAPERGVFLTAESLTFPGATIVVTTLLGLINVSVPGAATSVLWALGVSAAIGAVIIVLGMPAKGASDSRQRFGFVAVGIINIMLLTASALGINAYTQSEPISVRPESEVSGAP